MPIGGTREKKTMGRSYQKDPLYQYAKAYKESAYNILTEDTVDIFEEPGKALRRPSSRQALKKFFVENSFDTNNNTMSIEEQEDQIACMEAMFENDVEAINEHAVLPEYNPIVGMSLPIHKLIMMNMVFDKGVIPKVTAVQPKFTISLERRILVTPAGEEIDFFTEQNKMTDAINSTAPFKEIELTLPEVEGTDVLGQLGGTSLDNLVLSTAISAVMVPDCVIEVGDIMPNEDGYIVPGGEVAQSKTTADVWFPTNIEFKPNYGGPGHYERTVVYPFRVTVKKDDSGSVVVKEITETISGSMNKNLFNIVAMKGNITKVRLKTRLDASNGMLDTCSVKWKIDTDLVEIDTSIPINTTISPEEVKDLSAMYNVNQLTKLMSLYKTAMANYKDDTIKRGLDESFVKLNPRVKSQGSFDFAPRDGFALDHVEWRSRTFMDYLDDFVTVMLQVLNDPNMTISIVGDPRIVRKITPKEYSYTAPSSIGPVELDYTQTIVNSSDKRVYNFVGSDKMRGTNELMVILNPRNSERIVYRLYDYQMYVSNEIRNAANPALPALHAFERFKLVEYQPVQGRIQILNPSGLTN